MRVGQGDDMLVLKNACVLQFQPPEIRRGMDIFINKGIIEDVGENISENHPHAKSIDLGGNLISPGLVCAHNHFYSVLARGITAEIKRSTDFVGILRNLWWRLDRAIDEEILYFSGVVGAVEAIKAGCTAVIDHHASPSFIKGSLNVLKKAFLRAGLRGVLCYEVTDRNGEKGMVEGVEENIEFARSVDEQKKSSQFTDKGESSVRTKTLIEAAVGAHAPFTLGEETLGRLSEAVSSTGRGIHIHAGEDRYDSSFSHQMYGMDLMERLEGFRLLNDKAVFAHGVHLTGHDIECINSNNCFLVHNARSNMNNGVGYSENLPAFRNVALGTDGIGSDMLEELKFAYFKHRDSGGKCSPADFLKFLHRGNEILECYFGCGFGKIEKNCCADLVIYDYQNPTPLADENIAGHIVFGLSSGDVRTVIINGAVVYEDRKFPFDTGPVYEEAQRAAMRLWQRFKDIE
jgi:putative selenium metabolism protein SsnA